MGLIEGAFFIGKERAGHISTFTGTFATALPGVFCTS